MEFGLKSNKDSMKFWLNHSKSKNTLIKIPSLTETFPLGKAHF